MSVTGVPEAQKLIQEAKARLNSEEVQDAILPGAELVRDIAIRLVQQGPGLTPKGKRRLHLKELIFATKGKRRRKLLGNMIGNAIAGEEGPSVIAGVDLKKAPHAHLVEFGHGGPHPAPAYPFLRPAIAAARSRVVAIIETALRRLLARYSA